MAKKYLMLAGESSKKCILEHTIFAMFAFKALSERRFSAPGAQQSLFELTEPFCDCKGSGHCAAWLL